MVVTARGDSWNPVHPAYTYRACVTAGKCTPPQSSLATLFVSKVDGEFCNWEIKGREDHPINCVDWSQANAFCAAAGKRLPTEAELELAARGATMQTHPWGEEAPDSTRINGCGDECANWFHQDRHWGWNSTYPGSDGYVTTAPVGSFPAGASPFGALDMVGNVAEWTADWYGPYSAQPARNPTGPTEGTGHAIRGG